LLAFLLAGLPACREGKPQDGPGVLPRSVGAPTCETEQSIRLLLAVA